MTGRSVVQTLGFTLLGLVALVVVAPILLVVGTIVADNLNLGGTSCITMDLNPNAAYWMLKATMVR